MMPVVPPETAVPNYVGHAGLVGFLMSLVSCIWLDYHPAVALVLLILGTGAPMWWLEWRRLGCISPASSIELSNDLSLRARRKRWRLYGLLVVVGVWTVTLGIIPLAGDGVLVGFWESLIWLWPIPVFFSARYVLDPHPSALGGLECVGRWLSERGQRERFPWDKLRDQLVKAFFLPLMISFAYDWGNQAEPAFDLRWYLLPLALMYLMDTVFATIGYLSTSRRLDSHIRSSNPYWLGWASALVCYPPFFTWLKQVGFNYRDGYLWYDWLGASGIVAWGWGSAILLLTAIYVWATVAFGIRFSNLTNRGIITSGPYRYTKHPAYLSKNLSWWLISVPFISTAGFKTAVLHCLILFGMNGIYYLRAVTEERHLKSDPAYREYAAWISEHGLFARFRRLRWERSQSYRS